MDIQKSPGNNNSRKLTWFLMIIYLGVLLWILVLKLGTASPYVDDRRMNFMPFSKPLILNGRIDYGEMMLNILVFVPFGIYGGILFRISFLKKLLLFFSVSLLCEIIQVIIKIGSFDITDIITNTLGGVIGWLLLRCIEAPFKTTARAHNFINAIGSVATLIIVVLLVLLRLDMLTVRYR